MPQDFLTFTDDDHSAWAITISPLAWVDTKISVWECILQAGPPPQGAWRTAASPAGVWRTVVETAAGVQPDLEQILRSLQADFSKVCQAARFQSGCAVPAATPVEGP